MAFAQLTFRERLRVSKSSLRAQTAKGCKNDAFITSSTEQLPASRPRCPRIPRFWVTRAVQLPASKEFHSGQKSNAPFHRNSTAVFVKWSRPRLRVQIWLRYGDADWPGCRGQIVCQELSGQGVEPGGTNYLP